MNNQKREETFVCSCSELDHALRLSNFPGDVDGPVAYVDIVLRPDRSFWHRVATAFRYVFRRTCAFGEVSEILLTPEDQQRMIRFLEGCGQGGKQ